MTKNKTRIIYAFLAVATFMAFRQVGRCGFINFDDPLYIYQNSHIQNGLSMADVLWAFTTGHAANWHPVTWLSHMLDIELFGLDPHWHHLMNLFFHILNTLLLFFVLNRMTKAVWRSAFVAALFALHPLHVESVAWVSERKDVLSTCFWMLTMVAYSFYVERPCTRRYLSVLLLFVLGLMAKPMLVTLPFVLLLLDYWPLGRLERGKVKQKSRAELPKPMSRRKKKGKFRVENAARPDNERPVTEAAQGVTSRRALIGKVLREKIPFFILSALSSVITYVSQQKGGAVRSIGAMPLAGRIGNALVSYVAYIGKMIWPDNLAFFYPLPAFRQPWHILGAVIILATVTVIVILAANNHRHLIVGWLWYIGTLVPVIGIIQVGYQSRADRYTYVPLIGLFIMTAWGIPELLGRWRHREKALFASAALTLSCLFVVTGRQVGYWQSNFTLYSHAIDVTNNNYVAYFHRGNAYEALGDYKQAIADYDSAIATNKATADVYCNRGLAYKALGNYRVAIADYDKALQMDPGFELGHYDRGNAYLALGDYRRAIMDYDEALQIDPGFMNGYINRGNAYAALGNYDQANEDYDRAIEINPNSALTYRARAISYDKLGNRKRAYEDLKRAALLGDQYAQDLLRGKAANR